MCQPGRPSPQGEAQARLARLGPLPQHEIERIVLGFVHFDALAGAQVFQALAGQFSVTGQLAHRVQHVALRRPVGEPRSISRAIIAIISGTYSVARGSWSGGSMPRASTSSCIASMNRCVSASIGSPFSAARLMILSSMSVMLRT